MNTATLKIAIEVDDKGSVKIRDLGKAAEDTGKKGEKGIAGFREQVDKLKGSTDLTIGSLAGIAAIGFGTAIAGLAAISAKMLESIGVASNLAEAQGKFDVVFDGQRGKATAWANELTEAYGMSKREARETLSGVQDLLVPMGMMPAAAGEMSVGIAKLSADLGSFNNQPTAQVVGDIQSALVGSYEPMMKYGAVLTAATVEAKAMEMGLIKTKDELNASSKAQAAYQLIVEASSAAIGDMARTGDGYANQLKSFHAITEDLTAAMGQRLLPIAADVLGKINSGMRDGEGGVENLATMISVKLLQALGMAVETMRFFHNGWNGIKLVGTLAIDAIAQSVQWLNENIWTYTLKPLDLAFDGLVKLGAIEINPFEGASEAIGTFAASSRDVTNQVLADIESTNASYDTIKSTIDGYVVSVKTSAEQEAAAGQAIQDVHIQTSNVIAATAELSTKEREKAAKEAEKLTVNLTDKINQLTLSKYDYAVLKLKQEVAEMEKTAGQQKAILDQIAVYHKVKLDEINAAFGVSNQGITDSYMVLKEAVVGGSGSMTEMAAGINFKFGEMQETGEIALSKMSDDFGNFQLNTTGTEGSATYLFDDMDTMWTDLGITSEETTAKMGTDIDEFSTAGAEAFKNNLGNVLIEEFGGMDGAWGGTWDSMLKKMGDVLGEMVTSWSVSQIGNMFEGWDIFHAGVWNLEDDEVPSILQRGEMVIPRDAANEIREKLGNHGPDNWEGLTGAIGATSAANWGSPEEGMIAQGLKDRYGAMTASGVVGVVTGQISPLDMISGLLSPMTAVTALTGTMTETALSPYSPADSPYSSIGYGVGRGFTMAGIAGLGLPGMATAALGALGGLLGSQVGDLVGDLLDDRGLESIRDMMESGVIDAETALEMQREAQRVGVSVKSTSTLASLFGMISQGIASIGAMGRESASTTSNPFDPSSPYNQTDSFSMPDPDKFDLDGFTSPGYVSGSGQMNAPGQSMSSGAEGGESSSGGGPGQGGANNGGGISGGSGHAPGGEGEYALGGIVNSLKVPRGEDGWAALRLGEGIIDTDTMKILSASIRNGDFQRNRDVEEQPRQSSAGVLDNEEIGAILFSIATYTRKAAAILERFEYTGIPQSTREAVA